MTYVKHILSTLLLTLSITPAFASIPIFTQTTNMLGSYASQNDTVGGYGNFATVYDNFTLNGNYEINRIDWVGSYFNPQSQGQITAWTVTFYTDAGGQPGNACCSMIVPGNAGETFSGFDALGNPTYQYTIDIHGCCFTAGTQYWLSLVPDLGFPPQWGWETGTGGDGIAVQDF